MILGGNSEKSNSDSNEESQKKNIGSKSNSHEPYKNAFLNDNFSNDLLAKFETQIPHIQQFEPYEHPQINKDSLKESCGDKDNQDLDHVEDNVIISSLIERALDLNSYNNSNNESVKSKNKIQNEQKRIITCFVKAITSPTIEAANNMHHSRQSTPPLDKSKLLEMFFNYLTLDPPVSTSVFWKYINREVYVDRNIYRNRKIGGYKGLTGVQFRNPDNPSDFEIILSKLSNIESNLSRPKEALVEDLRSVTSNSLNKGSFKKRKKRSACDVNMDMDFKMYIDNQKMENNDLQYNLEDNSSSEQLNISNNNHSNITDTSNLTCIIQYLNSPTLLEVLKLLNDPNVLLALKKLKSMGEEYDESNTIQK